MDVARLLLQCKVSKEGSGVTPRAVRGDGAVLQGECAGVIFPCDSIQEVAQGNIMQVSPA